MTGLARWLRRLRAPWGRRRDGAGDEHRNPGTSLGALWVVLPPDGVRLLSSRPSKTGEGGRGVVARYSDGTTASAMVNSDGSVRVLFFRGVDTVPAVAVRGPGGLRFTWSLPSPSSSAPAPHAPP